MKAVIMAGGEGSRLRPISLNLPKPMVRLFDRPVMEHIIALLKRHGITQIAATLQFMPNMIRDYFGDGADFGVNLRLFTEMRPMGTAGGVAQCRKFIADEPFLVISGDAVCDFDLTAAYEFHCAHDADVTILLYRHPRPLEYGLVMTDEDGKIERFIEKPSWAQVFTDTVNTGIYIINSSVLNEIPDDQPYDFARDLFPKLLAEGRKLYGVVAEGYWCDIGDPAAFLNCSQDVLSGKVELSLPVPQLHPQVWTAQELPEDVIVKPPVYVGEGVTFGHGATIGPGAVLEERSFVGDGAIVANSIIKSAICGECSRVQDAIIGTGSILSEGASVLKGSVLGAGVHVGANATIEENLRIWNGVRIPAGEIISTNVIGGVKSELLFGDDGTISGIINFDITPESAGSLGCAIAACGMRIGIGYHQNGACEMVANAISAGISAAGAQITHVDAENCAVASYVAKSYLFDLTIFVNQKNEQMHIHFYDKLGLPIERQIQRKIEGELQRGEYKRAECDSITRIRRVSGAGEAYLAWVTADRKARELSVAVHGEHVSANILRTALVRIGCRIKEQSDGVIQFDISEDGMKLSIIDEDGEALTDEQVPALLALCFFKDGNDTLVMPYNAPAAIEHIAARYKGRVLRLGRDEKTARVRYSDQKVCACGVASAIFLASFIAKNHVQVAKLRTELPNFSILSCEVKINHDRGTIMRAIGDTCKGMHQELFEGLRVCVDGGWVSISPSISRSALRITGEGANEEIAAELCASFTLRAESLDKKDYTT